MKPAHLQRFALIGCLVFSVSPSAVAQKTIYADDGAGADATGRYRGEGQRPHWPLKPMLTALIFLAACFVAYANGANDNFKGGAICLPRITQPEPAQAALLDQ